MAMDASISAKGAAGFPAAKQPGAHAAQGLGFATRITAFRAWSEIAPELEGLEGSPFQSRHWLENWLAIFLDETIAPFLFTLRDPAGTVLLALPLVRRRAGGLTIIEVPDCGVTDYAAPLLRRARLGELPDGDTLFRLLRAALPPADLLQLNRMPPIVAGMANPFHTHPAARRNRLSGWRLPLPADYPTYVASLSRAHRDNLGKFRRRFERIEGARLGVASDAAEAQAMLACLDRMQEARVREMGLAYHLDEPKIAAFYRRLTETGAATGETQLCWLAKGDEILAVNFAICAQGELIYLRLTNTFEEWTRFSLGTVVTDLAIRTAFEKGLRVFDFAMGDYEYKRRFGAAVAPLHDLVLPLSLKGWPRAMAWHARDRMAKSTWIRRLTGRAALASEAG